MSAVPALFLARLTTLTDTAAVDVAAAAVAALSLILRIVTKGLSSVQSFCIGWFEKICKNRMDIPSCLIRHLLRTIALFCRLILKRMAPISFWTTFFALGLGGDALVDVVGSQPRGRGFDTAGCCRVVIVTAHARSTNSPRESWTSLAWSGSASWIHYPLGLYKPCACTFCMSVSHCHPRRNKLLWHFTPRLLPHLTVASSSMIGTYFNSYFYIGLL